MNNVAIITARGGSKRIPRKNIKDFMGQPMVAYAIKAALESKIFDEVMVSTDDIEIAEISKKYGASVPFMRSPDTANDYATTADVLKEVLAVYKEQGVSFDNMCCIYPCVPFLTAEILKEAYANFQGFEALIPVCHYPAPVEWALSVDDKGKLSAFDSKAILMRSQDLEPKYFDVGMFYFSTVSSFEKTGSLMPDNTTSYIIDEKYCQDIDTIDDWKMAEMKYRIMNG